MQAQTETDGPRVERSSSATLPASVRVFEVGDGLTVASIAQLQIQIWRSRASADAFDRIDGYYREMLTRHQRLAGLVVIESDNLAAPDAAARQRGGRLIQELGGHLGGLGFVLEGGSLKVNAVRFSLTTIALLASSPIPQPVFSTVDKGCSWVAGLLPDISAVRLSQIIAVLRRHHLSQA